MIKIFFKISATIIILFAGTFNAASQIPEANEYVTADIPCRILRVMNPANIDSIRLAVREWVNGNEECVFAILDNLSDTYIRNGSFTAFSCIAAVCNNAEDKISDYLVDINGSIFYSVFAGYASYLYYYKTYYCEDHCMAKYLITALALQIAASANESKERNIILEHIKTESKKFNLASEITDYIISLYKRADPAIWK